MPDAVFKRRRGYFGPNGWRNPDMLYGVSQRHICDCRNSVTPKLFNQTGFVQPIDDKRPRITSVKTAAPVGEFCSTGW
jgi:hypothetical protein